MIIAVSGTGLSGSSVNNLEKILSVVTRIEAVSSCLGRA